MIQWLKETYKYGGPLLLLSLTLVIFGVFISLITLVSHYL